MKEATMKLNKSVLENTGSDARAEMTIDEINEELSSPEMREMFGRMAQKLVEAVDQDTSILVPRPAESVQSTVSDWLSRYRNQFVAIMVDLFRQETPGLYPERDDDIRQFLIENLWPLAEDALRDYVARRLAVRWAARQYTDATVVLPPEREEYGWRLPIRIKGRDSDLGQIALDKEGNILKDRTTPRERFREVLFGAG